MSFRARSSWLTLAASAALACAVLSPAAGAAQRLESFALPSTQGNIDPAKVALNRVTSLRATVLLPDGYDEHPGQDYPVLYLLHGGGDNSEAWAHTGTGNVTKLAAGFPGIIVMPEGGRGSFADWWEGGARNGQRWTRYILDEVLPTVESRYRVRPGRQWHAIGGLSMGGYGAVFLGGQLPGYFGTILSMSGLLDTQTLSNMIVTQLAVGRPFEAVWGPVLGPYAEAHNPIRTIVNVAGSRLYLSTGNGLPDAGLPFKADAWTTGAAFELRLLAATAEYAAAAPFAGAQPTIRVRGGVHDWPYWRRELPKAIAWNLFGRPPVAGSTEARRWQYRTMEPVGNAWGIGYRFARPTTAVATFTRDGQRLSATGSGTVTISPGANDVDATGAGTRPDCAFTAALPFTRTLPDGC